MARAKLRSPKFPGKCHAPKLSKSLGRGTGNRPKPRAQRSCCKFPASKGNPRSLRRSDVKRHVRRSPMRAALPNTGMRSMKVKQRLQAGKTQVTFKPSTGFRKPKGLSRKIKLIDASPGKRLKKSGGGGGGGGGTPVLFIAKGSAKQGGKTKAMMKSPSSHSRRKHFGWKSGLMDARFKTMPKARAPEGVDFFYNLGRRVLHPKPAAMPARLRGGGSGGLAGGIAGGRLAGGRLQAGGLGAGPGAGIDERLTAGGPQLGGRSFGLGKFSRGTEPPKGGTGQTRPVGLAGSLRSNPHPNSNPNPNPNPNPVLASSAALAARDMVVPLTNRLPIIDFISTSEFHNMYAAQKQSRRFER